MVWCGVVWCGVGVVWVRCGVGEVWCGVGEFVCWVHLSVGGLMNSQVVCVGWGRMGQRVYRWMGIWPTVISFTA